MNRFGKMMMPGVGLLAMLAVGCFSATTYAQAPAGPAGPAPMTPGGAGGPGGAGRIAPVQPSPAMVAASHTLAPYFTAATAAPKPVDADGFLRRWLLLEPINKPNRGNTVFVDSYVRKNLADTEYFPGQFGDVPKNGDTVTAGDQQLKWHALDSSLFDVKLYNFAWGLSKQTYGVIFWAVTVVNSPREIEHVRMAVGSNSASMWWLNGKDSVDLFGDRRMVEDDVVSSLTTLHKGKNIVRGAVINGPGLSDFCVRFIDENGKPITGLTTSVQ